MVTFLCYVVSPLIVAGCMVLITGQSINRSQANRRRYLWACGIVMALMIGLRHYGNGSGDSYFYYNQWQALSTMPIGRLGAYCMQTDMEVGYLVTAWLLSHLFPAPQFVFILSGIFFAVSICLFVNRNCEDVILPLFIFNCMGLFNFMVQGLRQAIAICICLFALEACKKRKPRSFLVLVGTAMLFHASAIVFVVAYWLHRLKLDIKSVLMFAVMCIVTLLSLPTLIKVVNIVMNEAYTISTGITDGTGVVAIIIYIAIISFGLLTAYASKGRVAYSAYVYMAVLGMTALIMRNTIGGIAERVNHYFVCSQMVIIPAGMEKIKKGNAKLLCYIAIVLLYMGVALHKASYSVLIPYLFFWQ